MSVCEVKLKFEGCEDVITLKDQEVVKKCPCLQQSIEASNADWESTDTIIEEPVSIGFSKEAGDFVFTHIPRYTPPARYCFTTTVDDYPEANDKTLGELKEIIELADYLQCDDFMDCIGFVIAKKLEVLTIEEIAAYIGVPCNSKASIFDEADLSMLLKEASLSENDIKPLGGILEKRWTTVLRLQRKVNDLEAKLQETQREINHGAPTSSMSSRPLELEYGILKTVLQHMDPNLRIAMSLSMASIRHVNQVVPPQIRKLAIADGYTIVNDTSYEVGVLRHHTRTANLEQDLHKNLLSVLENAENLEILRLKMDLNGFDAKEYEHKIVRTAKRLVLENTRRETDTLLEVLHILRNPEICVQTPFGEDWETEAYFRMILAWLSEGRRIGDSFWMVMWDFETLVEVLDVILGQFEDCEESEGRVTVTFHSTDNEYSIPLSVAIEFTFDEENKDATKHLLKVEFAKIYFSPIASSSSSCPIPSPPGMPLLPTSLGCNSSPQIISIHTVFHVYMCSLSIPHP